MPAFEVPFYILENNYSEQALISTVTLYLLFISNNFTFYLLQTNRKSCQYTRAILILNLLGQILNLHS